MSDMEIIEVRIHWEGDVPHVRLTVDGKEYQAGLGSAVRATTTGDSQQSREEYLRGWPRKPGFPYGEVSGVNVCAQQSTPSVAPQSSDDHLRQRLSRAKMVATALYAQLKVVAAGGWWPEVERAMLDYVAMVGAEIALDAKPEPDTTPTENLVADACEHCGDGLVTIRGRHPRDARRQVCPACMADRLELGATASDAPPNKAYEHTCKQCCS